MSRKRFTRVAVLMFDRAPLFETSVPLSVFGVDRATSGAPRFDVLAVAAHGSSIRTTGGIELTAPHGLEVLRGADVIVVPSWRDPAERPPQPVLDALADAHARGTTVVGLCLGAFVLAAAGLLDGRRAATHWFHAPALAQQYPLVRVDPTVLFVDHGDVLTSAGTAAGIDACLHLVRTAHGARAAAAIARRMVVAPQRAGGQAQFIDQVVLERHGTDQLSDVLDHALAHLADELDVDDLVVRARMSRRTFDRRFRLLTGTSPHQWLLHQRILAAQRLLEDTDLPVDAVATKVGFGTGVSLRPHFRRIVGVSPQAYRGAFRAPQPTPEPTPEPTPAD
ncbi:MAG: GlxA family transcriptional regulator [Actinomycetes bacterium]